MATTTYGIYTSNRRQTHRKKTTRHPGGAAKVSQLQGYGSGAPKIGKRRGGSR